MHIETLDHVGLHVADVEQSRRFYAEILGLAEIERPELDFPGAWFGVGETQAIHLIGKNSEPGSPPRERHYALQVRDIAAWATHLRENGLEFTGPSARPDGALQVFLRDPDNHVIELMER